MEGLKITIPGTIDNEGNLRLNMTELREQIRPYRNQKVSMTIEVFNDGDVFSMRSWYKNHVLPAVVNAWIELGERYTTDQADEQLRKLTTVCHKDGELLEINDLDRAMLTRYLDECKILVSVNLHLTL